MHREEVDKAKRFYVMWAVGRHIVESLNERQQLICAKEN